MIAISSSLIQRKPGTRTIDIQVSMHAFAKELIALRDKENKLRSNRRYRNAIRSAFQKRGAKILSRATLILDAIERMRFDPKDKDIIIDELWDHIALNLHGGYVRMIPGKGVELVKP